MYIIVTILIILYFVLLILWAAISSSNEVYGPIATKQQEEVIRRVQSWKKNKLNGSILMPETDRSFIMHMPVYIAYISTTGKLDPRSTYYVSLGEGKNCTVKRGSELEKYITKLYTADTTETITN